MICTEDVFEKYKINPEGFCKERLNNPSSCTDGQMFPFHIEQKGKLRILHGTMEIANQMNTMASGLKKLGMTAITLNYYPTYLQYKSDIQINSAALKDTVLKDLAAKLIPQFDVFHLHFGTSLTKDHADLPLLKELNKKVLMQHWGSDVRLYSQAVARNPYVKVKTANEGAIRRQLEFLSKRIDTCVVCDQELYDYVKSYYSRVAIFPLVIDPKDFAETNAPLPNKKITIVHAPTSPEIKGTSHILKAIEELHGDYDFEFVLVKGMAYAQAKEIYRQADVIIDQLLIGSYGMFAIENMAMGKPVVCWISDYMQDKYPKELPVIRANPDTIKQVLAGLLANRDSLPEIGQQSRHYVSQYHDIEKYSSQLIDLYKTL